jgi:3-oxoacyl-[acyl-carrier protein] reductase
MTIDFRLDGRAAVVCGATGGIGGAIATAFAVAGASVTVVGRDEGRIQATLDSLEGSGHEGLRADFSDTDDVAGAAGERASRGPVHILVNNTGGPPAGKASESHHDSFLEAFTMHMASAQAMANAFVPGMQESGYGRIINVISTSVITPIEGLGVSNTVRGAMANWGRTLAVELGSSGITVNNILPGFTDTDRLKTLFEGKAKRLDTTLDEVTAKAISSIPAGRIAKPEELAAAALFLASPAGSYVNGVNLPVDGGRVCKG